ncbi:MAG: hypothetical protein OXB95_05675 [Rhodobacteraceae bacterium]|nr:hypothetical protein [Paracoccaceae bacterium]
MTELRTASDRKVILLLGGSKSLSEFLGVSRRAVTRWQQNNWIPHKHRLAVSRLIKEVELPVDVAEFVLRSKPKSDRQQC